MSVSVSSKVISDDAKQRRFSPVGFSFETVFLDEQGKSKEIGEADRSRRCKFWSNQALDAADDLEFLERLRRFFEEAGGKANADFLQYLGDTEKRLEKLHLTIHQNCKKVEDPKEVTKKVGDEEKKRVRTNPVDPALPSPAYMEQWAPSAEEQEQRLREQDRLLLHQNIETIGIYAGGGVLLTALLTAVAIALLAVAPSMAIIAPALRALWYVLRPLMSSPATVAAVEFIIIGLATLSPAFALKMVYEALGLIAADLKS